MPPLGLTTQLRIFIDPYLLQYDLVDKQRCGAPSSRPPTYDALLMAIRELVQLFYEKFWNEKDLGMAEEILHSDVTFRGSVGIGAHGRRKVCDYVVMVTTALSDYR